jgi:signal transduction histidine kinase
VAVDQASERRGRFDLSLLVEECMLHLKPGLLQAAVQLQLDLAPQLELDSYPRAISHILGQLTRNAQQHGFGSEGGQIAVRTRLDDGMAVLDYLDNGSGIDAAHLGRVFEPFFTTRMGVGTGGLGLHIVHNLLVNVLGGAVEVSSEPGQTRFTLRLPLTAPALGGS